MKIKKKGLLTVRFESEFAEKIKYLTDKDLENIIRYAIKSEKEKNGELPKIQYYPLKKDKIKEILSCQKIFIDIDCQWTLEEKVYELTANDFLAFSLNHSPTLSIEERVNIISNLKKAIDNQIDWFFTYLGIDPKNLNDKNYPYYKSFISKYTSKNENNHYKIQFLEALNFLDLTQIQKIRKIRNKLEHNYSYPSKINTKNAIKNTKKFIETMHQMIYDKMITTCYLYNEPSQEPHHLPDKYIQIDFIPKYLKSKIRIVLKINQKNYRLIVHPKDEMYLYIIKALLTQNFESFLQCISPNLYPTHIEINYC